MKSDALETRDPTQWLATQTYSNAELDILRRFICVDFRGQSPSDGELMFFMLYCKQHGLDPFAKQAHLLKTKNGPQVCLGIDGMRIRAAQSGEYGGQDEPAFEADERGNVLACKVVVYRLVQGQRLPFSAIAWMAESRGTSPIWSQRPRGMLEKCAEAKALRKGFPDRVGAFYAPEEIDGQDTGFHRQATATAADINDRLLPKKTAPETLEAQVVDLAKPQHEALLQAFEKIGVSLTNILEFADKKTLAELTQKDIDKLREWYQELTNEVRE